MNKRTIRFLAATFVAVIGAFSLTACGSSSSSTESSMTAEQSSRAEETQSSVVETTESEDSGTTVKDYLAKAIDLSAYEENDNDFNAKNASGIVLSKSITYADGNTFSLGELYKDVVEKGYTTDCDNEELKPHLATIVKLPKNSKGEHIEIAMVNDTGEAKPMQECEIYHIQYVRHNPEIDPTQVCLGFEYQGFTQDSSIKDILTALGKNPDSIVVAENLGFAVLMYEDKNNDIMLNITVSAEKDRVNELDLRV